MTGWSVDAIKDVDSVLKMTSEKGFDRKIQLISNADDMSTEEKILAINNAEDKRQLDIEKNAETYNKIIWTKAGAKVLIIATSVAVITSPKGRRVIKTMFEKVA